MLMHSLRLAGFISLLWVVPALAQSSATVAPAWIAALRDGGYVIVVRHGATYADQADTNPFDPKDTAHQRQLNDAGRAAAKSMGDALRKLKIPVGKVQTSQFQRAVETGTLLGFGEVSSTADIAEGGLVVTPNENNRRTAALRTLAGTAPPAGRHERHSGQPQAQHRRRLRQGLVRRPRRRGLDLPARRQGWLHPGGPTAGRGMDEAGDGGCPRIVPGGRWC